MTVQPHFESEPEYKFNRVMLFLGWDHWQWLTAVRWFKDNGGRFSVFPDTPRSYSDIYSLFCGGLTAKRAFHVRDTWRMHIGRDPRDDDKVFALPKVELDCV